MPNYYPPASGGAGGGTPDDNSVTSAKIVDGAIVNADINAAAAVALSKLASDPLARANHTGTQLLATISDAGTLAALSAVASAQITDGTIVGGDLSSTIAIPSAATATTQSAADSSTKVATTAFATTADNLLAPLASPTFTGTPSLPTGTTATTQSVNDSSTKLATTAALVAQAKVGGPSNMFGPNSYWNFPYYLTGSQIAVPNAGDGRWFRATMGQSGTLHDVSFLVNTTGGNYNILVLDDGQANATHTVRTCLALKGSTSTPAASAYITYDPALTVAAGDTLVFMLTFDGTSAKAASSTGSLGGIAMPASFFPGSGAATTSTKICGTCLSASVPGSVNATVTDANMVAAANAFFCIWRIT